MRIVITGASGNVGTALLRRLHSSDHELIGLARRPPDSQADGTRGRQVRWARVDLTREDCAPTLREAFRGADAVVHLAWGFQPTHNPGYLEELGVGGTRRVLAAAASERVPHLVHMSSIGAYSPKVDDKPVDENYPTGGIPGSVYSAHKAAAERLLDEHEGTRATTDDAVAGPPTRITRFRPGIIGQRSAGSSLLRYGVPGWVPARAIKWVPVLPLDQRLVIPLVHADDVAHAIEQALIRPAFGTFNLAAAPAITPRQIAAALEARTFHIPARILRTAVTASWRTRLQPIDPGWLDLAMPVPLLDTSKALDVLGWAPTKDAEAVLQETLAGICDATAGNTPVLRPRTVLGTLNARIRRGPISRRSRP